MVTLEEKKQRKPVQLIEHDDDLYHKQYRRTVRICAYDTASADVLRVYEVLSNQRTNALIEKYGIPEPYYPDADDLWIDELTVREIEERTFKNRGKSTYARVIADCSLDKRRPSLLQRGYLRARYIARPYDAYAEPDDVPTTIYYDHLGPFIVVRNRNGTYIGDDGSLCCARSQGYPLVTKQYRCEIEVIRAAIAKCTWKDPPQPRQRWQPIVQRRVSTTKKEDAAEAAQETTNSHDAYSDASEKDEQHPKNDARRGGTNAISASGAITLSDSENTMNGGDVATKFPEKFLNVSKPIKQPVKLYRDAVNKATLCNATWSAETIIALSSFVLDVPERPSDDDDEALLRWYSDWLEPAQRLYTATLDLSPIRAWERLDLTTRYMATPGSPSWWQRGPESGKDWRKTKAPITLRNVADHHLIQYDDFIKQRSWWPSETTQYFGPPLEIEEEDEAAPMLPAPAIEADVAEVSDGHITAITEVNDDQEAVISTDEPQPAGLDLAEPDLGSEAPERDEAQRADEELPPGDESNGATVEAVPRRAFRRFVGMTDEAVLDLADAIRDTYPGLLIDYRPVAQDRWIIEVQLDKEHCFGLDWLRWHRMSQQTQQLIEQALLYAASLDGGGSSPPQESNNVEEVNESDQRSQDGPDHQGSGLSSAVLGPASG